MLLIVILKGIEDHSGKTIRPELLTSRWVDQWMAERTRQEGTIGNTAVGETSSELAAENANGEHTVPDRTGSEPAHENADESKTAVEGKDSNPFSALLGAWALLTALIAVAGFSARWSYYYNFGVSDLALQTPVISLPIYALEVIRKPDSLGNLSLLLLMYIVPFQLLLFLLDRGSSSRWRWLRSSCKTIMEISGLNSPFFVQAIRASLIVYVAFEAGSDAGYNDYVDNTGENSPLSVVSLVTLPAKNRPALPIVCDPHAPTVAVIGDAKIVTDYLNAGYACTNTETGMIWRLLYRSEKSIYIFSPVPAHPEKRPYMIVIPNNDKLTLVTR